MVNPTSGPFSTDVNQDPVFSLQKTWYRQKKPYNLVLAYAFRQGRRIKQVGPNTSSASGAISAAYGKSTREQAIVLSSAYEKLKGRVSDSASLGASLAEYSQAARMIGTRAQSLLKAYRAARHFDVKGVADALGVTKVPPVRDWRRSGRGAGGLFLEFHFGWAPLVDDITSAVDILASPGPLHKRVSATASTPFSWFDPSQGLPSGASGFDSGNGVATCKMGGRFEVTNHNLFLANQLGLTNPLVVAWELVPFSFLVDHIVNVAQFLSLGTDYLGLAVTDSYTVEVQELTNRTLQTFWPAISYFVNEQYSAVRVDRVTGLKNPSLVIRPFRIPSWTRAATYMSLLAQTLKG